MGNGNHSINILFGSNKFIGSFESINKIPLFDNFLECCFIGRSNVGKSSIINSITKNKKLAKTSKTPGCTKTINIFNIKENIILVDLPGYGYAKASKLLKYKLNDLIQNYFEFRTNLNHVFLLIDIKVGIKNSDIDMFDLLSSFQINFSIVFTKIDKTQKIFIEKQNKSIISLMKNYSKYFSKIFFTSSKTNYGIIDIQKEIYRLSQSL